MRREPLKFGVIIVLIFALAGEVFLLLSGKRILLGETYVSGHEEFIGLSSYVPKEEAKYECTYFTGRKRVFESLSSNQFDECPFIWTEG